MGKFITNFDTTAEFAAFSATTAYSTPHVTLIKDGTGVQFIPYVPPTPTETRVVAKFNVTNTIDPTKIISQYADSPFSAIEIDGVEQQSVTTGYTFSTKGEHTVKYTLTDPTSIGELAFYGCAVLTSIDIPSGVTSINDAVFFQCISLTSVTVNAVTPPTLGSDAFDNANNCPIYVPSGSVDAYKAASGWSTYASRIQAIA